MNVGFIGLGKLGLPVALAINYFGKHNVFGYDISEEIMHSIKAKKAKYQEERLEELLLNSELKLCESIEEVVTSSDIIFAAIQTPHDPEYEGITRLPETRVDFNYEFLKKAVVKISQSIKHTEKILIIISTVLPGTMEREIMPSLNDNISLFYNPFFIAMGTTIYDFINPEFVLIGHNKNKNINILKEFYGTLHNKPIFETSIEAAELIKVGYNTFIGMKIIFANAIMEISHKIGANCDDITKAFSLASDRLISPKYLKGGMGDGGGCHPRDNIAMSHFARKLNLSHDIFQDLMQTREDQTEWLAQLLIEESKKANLPMVICGLSYKPDTNLTVGSPSILLKNILNELGYEPGVYDPHLTDAESISKKAIFFIGTMHACFNDTEFPEGSVILDPWGYLKEKKGVKLIKIGRI